MTCIIVEDQPPAQRILKKYIKDLGTLALKATFSDAIQAMNFLQAEQVDLMFLDIHLPKISGIDFLQTIAHPPKVILTTAFSEYALESYEFNVVDYLLKPFSFQRFVKAVAKVPHPQKQIPIASQQQTEVDTTPTSLFIKSGYEWVKIKMADIIYIKADADYTEIKLTDKKHLSAESLRHWEATLDSKQFVRVHKSYIVHLDKVEKVAANQIYFTNGMSVPIGRAYKEGFLERIG